MPTNSYDTAVGCLSQLKTKQTENNSRRAVGTVGKPVIPALRKLCGHRGYACNSSTQEAVAKQIQCYSNLGHIEKDAVSKRGGGR